MVEDLLINFKKMLKKNLLLVFLILIFQQSLSAEIIKVFDFTEIEFETLKVKKVRGADNKTIYSLGKNENGNFLRSEAENSASGLGKKIKINLSKTPFLNITWKVEKDLSGIGAPWRAVRLYPQIRGAQRDQSNQSATGSDQDLHQGIPGREQGQCRRSARRQLGCRQSGAAGRHQFAG